MSNQGLCDFIQAAMQRMWVQVPNRASLVVSLSCMFAKQSIQFTNLIDLFVSNLHILVVLSCCAAFTSRSHIDVKRLLHYEGCICSEWIRMESLGVCVGTPCSLLLKHNIYIYIICIFIFLFVYLFVGCYPAVAMVLDIGKANG